MSFPKKLILAAGLLLIIATDAAQSLQCYECKDLDGKCAGRLLVTCAAATVTEAAATAAADAASVAAARGDYADYADHDSGDEEPKAHEAKPSKPPADAPAPASAPADAGSPAAAPAEAFIQHQDPAAPAPAPDAAGSSTPAAVASGDWFCATLTGKMNKTDVTFKGCSVKENDCSGLEPKAGGFEKTACTTCKKDKCNSGVNFKPITLPLLLVIVMLFISVYY